MGVRPGKTARRPACARVRRHQPRHRRVDADKQKHALVDAPHDLGADRTSARETRWTMAIMMVVTPACLNRRTFSPSTVRIRAGPQKLETSLACGRPTALSVV